MTVGVKLSRKQRLNDILKLINEYEIDTQDELTNRLNAIGYNVSQATVSRDISDLNLIKTFGLTKKFKYIKALDNEKEIPKKIIDLFKQVTLSITCANNLIVVKTLPGNAGTVGMTIDEMHLSKVLGTVAGDDVLLIITKTNQDAEILLKSLKSL